MNGDLRNNVVALFPKATEVIAAPISQSGYIHVKRTYSDGVRYASVGEFKVFPSTEEKFNRAMGSGEDYDLI